MRSGNPIFFIGPFPPPVHGQAVSTAHLKQRLEEDGVRVVVFDTSEGLGSLHLRHVRKLARHLLPALLILLGRPASVYLSVNANAGMFWTSLIARVVRLKKMPLLLHHHTRSHLVQGHPRLDVLCRAAGSEAVHVTVCPIMDAMIRAAHPLVQKGLTYSNVGVVEAPSNVPEKAISRRPFVLGHLGNLTIEKGLVRAIETFRAAKASGIAQRLILAGPVQGGAEMKAITEAGMEFGEAFEWRGSVHGQSKESFFADIDVFLFPSLYDNETQGIVNLEALSRGVPVVAFGVCCTTSDLQGPAAATISPERNFADGALSFIALLDEQSPSQARTRFDMLLAENSKEYVALRNALVLAGC